MSQHIAFLWGSWGRHLVTGRGRRGHDHCGCGGVREGAGYSCTIRPQPLRVSMCITVHRQCGCMLKPHSRHVHPLGTGPWDSSEHEGPAPGTAPALRHRRLSLWRHVSRGGPALEGAGLPPTAPVGRGGGDGGGARAEPLRGRGRLGPIWLSMRALRARSVSWHWACGPAYVPERGPSRGEGGLAQWGWGLGGAGMHWKRGGGDPLQGAPRRLACQRLRSDMEAHLSICYL